MRQEKERGEREGERGREREEKESGRKDTEEGRGERQREGEGVEEVERLADVQPASKKENSYD